MTKMHSSYDLIPGDCARWHRERSGASIRQNSSLTPSLYHVVNRSARSPGYASWDGLVQSLWLTRKYFSQLLIMLFGSLVGRG
jgi:hypothetical protein